MRAWRARRLPATAVVAALLVLPLSTLAASGQEDPVLPVVLGLAVILAAAKVGGEAAVRLGQPAVLGELLVGVLLGNLPMLGFGGLQFLKADAALDVLSRLGVLVLLFEVGLESTVDEMLKVGTSSLLVALLGVAAPFALGWAVGAWLVPAAGPYVHAFLGATLSATSVGITARVLQDLGRSQTSEARIILGAAVIDDVLGLVILAVVSGAIVAADLGGSVSYGAVGGIVSKSALFLAGALLAGHWLLPPLFRGAARLRTHGVLLAAGLVLCMAFSWLSGVAGLAPIVGAFAAGLVLESAHYQGFVERGERSLEELVHPISAFLVPVFFVMMGMRTELRSLVAPGVLGLAAALTVAGIAGKQVCSLGVVARGVDRLTVGIGMVPRGEVGLIFASVGLSLTMGGKPLLDAGTYSAIVILVIVTTLLTPPALRWSLSRSRPA